MGKKCKKCGSDLPSKGATCSSCGYEPDQGNLSGKVIMILLVMVILFSVGLFVRNNAVYSKVGASHLLDSLQASTEEALIEYENSKIIFEGSVVEVTPEHMVMNPVGSMSSLKIYGKFQGESQYEKVKDLKTPYNVRIRGIVSRMHPKTGYAVNVKSITILE